MLLYGYFMNNKFLSCIPVIHKQLGIGFIVNEKKQIVKDKECLEVLFPGYSPIFYADPNYLEVIKWDNEKWKTFCKDLTNNSECQENKIRLKIMNDLKKIKGFNLVLRRYSGFCSISLWFKKELVDRVFLNYENNFKWKWGKNETGS